MTRIWQRRHLSAGVFAGMLLTGWYPSDTVASDGRADGLRAPLFSVTVQGVTTPHPVLALMVMPEERLPLSIHRPTKGDRYTLTARAGTLNSSEPASWTWRAPREPGMYPLRLRKEGASNEMTLNVFVLRPASEMRDSRLNGYRIGSYPSRPLRTDPRTLPPRGFIEVYPRDLETLVSPHFRLGQFLSKQKSDFPKYVLIEAPLLIKLEALITRLHQAGIQTDTLHVLSGFRTPFYNAAIKNVKYSQHQWGRAADVFVDMDGDHWMDDLDGDGKSDLNDARFLKAILLEMYEEPWYRPLQGGLGLYAPSARRPAFLHIDTRGWPARW